MEGHGLIVILHGYVARQGNFETLSLLKCVADDRVVEIEIETFADSRGCQY